VSEKTAWEISPRRKVQLAKAIERAQKIQASLDKLSEGKGVLAIMARAISLNITDYIAALKSTRFVD
jgi:uncharacterized HAD superfamily protein